MPKEGYKNVFVMSLMVFPKILRGGRLRMRTQTLAISDFDKVDEYPCCEICSRQISAAEGGGTIKLLKNSNGGIMFACHPECNPRDFFQVERMKNNDHLLYGMDFVFAGSSFRCTNFPRDGRVKLADNSGHEVEKGLNELSVEIDGEIVRIG
jgi:hypothetical protein